MKKVIITTTIDPPSEAYKKFAKMKDWHMIIVGDLKTPHKQYEKFVDDNDNVIYLSPYFQEQEFAKLSELIGWNCIQRRNFGLVLAYKYGYDIIATVDNDNIPLENWGKNLMVGKTVNVYYHKIKDKVFNPLSETILGYYPYNKTKLWHRGFPLELVKNKRDEIMTSKKIKVLVQADLWNGELDVDAIERLCFETNTTLDGAFPFASNKISPFNSQNTFLHRSVLRDYFLFPHIGRMDDIWGGYYLQSKHPRCVIYGEPSVFQKRNPHSIVRDMKNEMLGYEHTMDFINDLPNIKKWLPKESWEAFKEYQRLLK